MDAHPQGSDRELLDDLALVGIRRSVVHRHGRLFVGDHQSGTIVVFDLAGAELARLETGASELMGLTIGPQGRLWYVDGGADQLVRVDP